MVIMVRYSVHARAAHVWTPALASAMVSDRTRAGGCRMRGRGSAGRASPCQGEGRGFESRRPLGASLAQSLWGEVFPGGVAERRGNGLQIRVHGFKSRLHLGRLAQWERASLTRKRSLVQIQYRPPASHLVRASPGARPTPARVPRRLLPNCLSKRPALSCGKRASMAARSTAEHRPQLLAIDLLSDAAAGMANQVRDVLDSHARAG